MTGKYYESDYEEALIELLKEQGWRYTYGKSISRNNREPILIDDFTRYLDHRYPDLTTNDILEILNHLRHVGGQTHFDVLRNVLHPFNLFFDFFCCHPFSSDNSFRVRPSRNPSS